mgnify:CR=1 FL=1
MLGLWLALVRWKDNELSDYVGMRDGHWTNPIEGLD